MISNLLDKSNVTFYGANIFKSENFYRYEQYNIQYCFKYKTLNFTETTVTTLQGKGKPFNGNEGLIGGREGICYCHYQQIFQLYCDLLEGRGEPGQI
jgi:hypothetical protein